MWEAHAQPPEARVLRRYAGRAFDSEKDVGGAGTLMVKGLKSMWRQAPPIVRNTLQGVLTRIIMQVALRALRCQIVSFCNAIRLLQHPHGPQLQLEAWSMNIEVEELTVSVAVGGCEGGSGVCGGPDQAPPERAGGAVGAAPHWRPLARHRWEQ